MCQLILELNVNDLGYMALFVKPKKCECASSHSCQQQYMLVNESQSKKTFEATYQLLQLLSTLASKRKHMMKRRSINVAWLLFKIHPHIPVSESYNPESHVSCFRVPGYMSKHAQSPHPRPSFIHSQNKENHQQGDVGHLNVPPNSKN